MGQLDGDGGRNDPFVARIAELRGEQHQRGAEPLAARFNQVRRRLAEEIVLRPGRPPQAVLNLGQAFDNLRRERGVG